MIRDLCDGQLDGAAIGSTEITFTPGKIRGGTHSADTKTAGYVAPPSPLGRAAELDLDSRAGPAATWTRGLTPLTSRFLPFKMQIKHLPFRV